MPTPHPLRRFLALAATLAGLVLPVPVPAADTDTTAPPTSVTEFPADDAFPGQGPLRKADWFRNLWIERRTAWWQERAQDRSAVVFLGDSITQGWNSLATDFPGIKVANRGISGDVTRGLLCRLHQDVLDLDPRAVVLLIGTNDLEEGGDPETIVKNVKLILAVCRRHSATMPVVLCEVMPSSASKKRPAARIKQINAGLIALAKANPQVVRCDTWTLFANADGDARPDEFPDLLHPNATGYAKWAAALRPIFTQLKLASP